MFDCSQWRYQIELAIFGAVRLLCWMSSSIIFTVGCISRFCTSKPSGNNISTLVAYCEVSEKWLQSLISGGLLVPLWWWIGNIWCAWLFCIGIRVVPILEIINLNSKTEDIKAMEFHFILGKQLLSFAEFWYQITVNHCNCLQIFPTFRLGVNWDVDRACRLWAAALQARVRVLLASKVWLTVEKTIIKLAFRTKIF